MKLKTFAIACALAIAVFVFAQRHSADAPKPTIAAVVDLTHPLSEKVPTYEVEDKSPYEAHSVATIQKDGYFARAVSFPEHFGTHLDAPAHFAAGRWTVDQIPPQRLVGPLVVLDVSGKAAYNPDYLVSVEDVALWERVKGQIQPGSIVIARTGWATRWNDAKSYRNADAKGVMHFPAYALDTIRLLAEARKVSGIGIDTLSVDPGASKDFPVHHFGATQGMYNLENVANLSQAPETGAIAVVAPIKLEGGSGGPVRIFALVR